VGICQQVYMGFSCYSGYGLLIGEVFQLHPTAGADSKAIQYVAIEVFLKC